MMSRSSRVSSSIITSDSKPVTSPLRVVPSLAETKQMPTPNKAGDRQAGGNIQVSKAGGNNPHLYSWETVMNNRFGASPESKTYSAVLHYGTVTLQCIAKILVVAVTIVMIPWRIYKANKSVRSTLERMANEETWEGVSDAFTQTQPKGDAGHITPAFRSAMSGKPMPFAPPPPPVWNKDGEVNLEWTIGEEN